VLCSQRSTHEKTELSRGETIALAAQDEVAFSEFILITGQLQCLAKNQTRSISEAFTLMQLLPSPGEFREYIASRAPIGSLAEGANS
jgi:hypothetical protein